jgi:outer membrane protein OmpA-like peptidoglycan-associated protein/flagellar hook assembly protein FlgD
VRRSLFGAPGTAALLLCALVYAFIFLPGTATAETLPGAQWYYTGAGAANLASGGATGAGRGTVQDVLFNPAALALNENLLIGASYGTFTDKDHWAQIGISLPQDFGVFTFNLLYGGFTDADPGAGTGVVTKGSFSKLITPNFHFGAGLGLLLASPTPDSLATRPGAHIDLGFIILQNGTVRELEASALEEGFGFFDRAFSFSFNNIGFNPSWGEYKQYPEAHVRSGLGFNFFKNEFLKLNTRHELSLSFDDFSPRYSAGLGIGFFNIVSLRAGLNFGDTKFGYHTLGAGLDFRNTFDGFGFDLSYAMVPFQYNKKREIAHFVTLNLAFGSNEREPPKPDILSRLRHFSPNGDGVQDTAFFDTRLTGKQEIEGWQITIQDSDSRVVRQLGDLVNTDESLSVKKFFSVLFSSRGYASIPEYWEWDGRDDEGQILPDGTYTYQIKVRDTHDKEFLSRPRQIDIRTVPPEANIDIKLTLFSPNRGGERDVLVVEQTLVGRDTRWTGNMLDANGKIVRTFSWGENPPAKFEWDGRDNNGRIAPDGNYEYRVEGRDLAGNSVSEKFSGILLSTRRRPIHISASTEIFAPGSGNRLDTVRFTPTLEARDLLEDWKVEIADQGGNVVRSFEGDIRVPSELAWDGRDQEGNQLNDGMYTYNFSAKFADGDAPRTAAQPVRILTKAPDIRLNASPRLFAPDDSEGEKQLRISLQFEEIAVISNWQIVVRSGDTIFKTFSGEKPETKTLSILWDGKGDTGELVESAATYILEARAVDVVGNTGRSSPVSIDIDILVVRTSRGLQILITNIEFAFGSWDLSQEDSPVLNRVSDVLKRYSDYKIIIEGHTDNIGAADYNLMLSTRRARTVLRYLVRRGIEDRRMIARGLGMTMPIASNATEAGRAKNRRVEFILVKDE